MKFTYIAQVLLLSFFVLQSATAQKRTVETRTPVDSTTTVIVTETEDITPRERLFIVNPVKFFLFYNLSYYQMITPRIALGGGVQFPTPKDLDGIGLNAEARIYTDKKARGLKGFYVAPRVAYNRISEDGDQLTALAIGGRAGWQWFPGKNFGIGFGLGVDYYYLDGKENGQSIDFYEGTVPVVRFNIGYAF